MDNTNPQTDYSKQAVAYLRTSTPTNVGEGKDSQTRQMEAIEGYATRAGLELVGVFYDAGVTGTTPIESRPQWASLMDRIEGNGVRTVIIEDATRFARTTLVQELGIMLLQSRGVTVFTANGDNLTQTDDPMKTLMRQVAGAFAQYERTRLVAKLKAARDRKRATLGYCEGNSIEKTDRAACDMARAIKAANPKATLLSIAYALFDSGHYNTKGNRFDPKVIKSMIERNGKASQA